jgi:hypothetical protein
VTRNAISRCNTHSPDLVPRHEPILAQDANVQNGLLSGMWKTVFHALLDVGMSLTRALVRRNSFSADTNSREGSKGLESLLIELGRPEMSLSWVSVSRNESINKNLV